MWSISLQNALSLTFIHFVYTSLQVLLDMLFNVSRISMFLRLRRRLRRKVSLNKSEIKVLPYILKTGFLKNSCSDGTESYVSLRKQLKVNRCVPNQFSKNLHFLSSCTSTSHGRGSTGIRTCDPNTERNLSYRPHYRICHTGPVIRRA